MRVVNLASGSKGNCTFFEAGGVKILIDAGLPLREISARLALVGERIDNINAVLITHEHTDHIKGLVALMKGTRVHAYVPEVIVREYLRPEAGLLDRISMIGEYSFSIGPVRVTAMRLPHDSMVCFGYMLECAGRRVAIVTDLGYMPGRVLELLYGCSLIFIESNHDKKLLASCYYPRIVKLRIAGEGGHLSNDQAAAAIVELARHGTKHFVLSHMSENSNTIEAAFLTVSRALEDAGFEMEKDVFIRYSRQDRPGNNFFLGEDNV